VKREYQETSDNLKNVDPFNNKFKLLNLNVLLICVTVNIQNVLQSLTGRHGDVCAAGHGIVNSTVFHFSPHINQMPHQIIHVLHFCLVDSLLSYAPAFVVNWIVSQGCSLVRAVRRPQIWKFRGVAILDYCTLGVEAASDDAQTFLGWGWGGGVNTTCGKDHSQKNLPKLISNVATKKKKKKFIVHRKKYK